MLRTPLRARRATSALSLLALGVTVLISGTTTEATAADTTMCNGRPTTAVVRGPADVPAASTAGDDVVAIEGAAVVLNTLDGNDAVCVFGPDNGTVIDTGPGTDYVSTAGDLPAGIPGIGTTVTLGSGADTFVGGPGSDTVNSVTDDAVSDVVDLGAGDDTLVVVPSLISGLAMLPLAPVRGGEGTDTLSVTDDVVSVDNVSHTLTSGFVTTSFDGGFETFRFPGPIQGGSIVFRGSAAAETLEVETNPFGTHTALLRTLTADMGDGDDAILVDEGVSGSWDGGLGEDTLTTVRNNSIPQSTLPALNINLAKGFYAALGYARTTLAGLESFDIDFYRFVRVIGGPASETIHVLGCRADVQGNKGNDRITLDADKRCSKKLPLQLTASGGPGNDKLTGAKGPDVLRGDGGNDKLLGKPGRDVASGGPGRDTCVAERKAACEK